MAKSTRDDSETKTDKLKKIRIRNGYISKSKDGMVIGKRTGHGKHVTLLGDMDGSITLHFTDQKSGKREHLFRGKRTEEFKKELRNSFEVLVRSLTPKRHPKYVYAIPDSIFKLDLRLSKGGKEATAKIPTSRQISELAIRMPFSEFLKSNHTIAFTSHGTEMWKGSSGYIVLYKNVRKRIENLMLKDPFLAALDKAHKRL